jgi:hypothetical protein
MNQIISILDSYAYRTLVWDIYVERVSRPASGAAPDEQRIAASLPRAENCLAAISGLMDEGPLPIARLTPKPCGASSHETRRWREMDSNHRSPVRWTAILSSPAMRFCKQVVRESCCRRSSERGRLVRPG